MYWQAIPSHLASTMPNIFRWGFLLLWHNFDNFMRIKLNWRKREHRVTDVMHVSMCVFWSLNWKRRRWRKLRHKNTSKSYKNGWNFDYEMWKCIVLALIYMLHEFCVYFRFNVLHPGFYRSTWNTSSTNTISKRKCLTLQVSYLSWQMHVVFKFCKNDAASVKIGIVLRDILTSFMFRWNYHMLLRCYLTFITIFDYSSELQRSATT